MNSSNYLVYLCIKRNTDYEQLGPLKERPPVIEFNAYGNHMPFRKIYLFQAVVFITFIETSCSQPWLILKLYFTYILTS